MKRVPPVVLFIVCIGALSWYRGYSVSLGCVGNLCADAGFAWSAIGSILLLVASTLLAGVLLAKLWVKGGIFYWVWDWQPYYSLLRSAKGLNRFVEITGEFPQNDKSLAQ